MHMDRSASMHVLSLFLSVSLHVYKNCVKFNMCEIHLCDMYMILCVYSCFCSIQLFAASALTSPDRPAAVADNRSRG